MGIEMYIHPLDTSNCDTSNWPGEAIRVWKFEHSPKVLKDLSACGGDEDWLAVIPPEYKDKWIPWMESGSEFGCCSVDEYDHPYLKGFKVRIGSHA